MEKKTIQRIIGILVAIALVIVVMPLFVNRQDITTETITIKEPTFPDQEIQQQGQEATMAMQDPKPAVSTPNAQNGDISHFDKGLDESIERADALMKTGPEFIENPNPEIKSDPIQPHSENSLPEANPLTPTALQPVANIAQQDAYPAQPQPMENAIQPVDPATPAQPMENTALPSHPMENAAQVVNPALPSHSGENQSQNSLTPSHPTEDPAAPTTNSSAQLEPKASEIQNSNPKTQKIIKAIQQKEFNESLPRKKITSASRSNKKLTSQLNKAAWIVQLGSFKNKNNALRLADKLRSNGYKAFVREVKAKSGVQTRVYVGPEFNQASAMKLSSQLAQKMNLQGFVITYQPLEL